MKQIHLKRNMMIVFASCIAMGITSCKHINEEHPLGLATDMIFSKGEKVSNDNFVGTVWLNYLLETDSVHNVNIGSVTFEPGARTNWHTHKGGQILLVTEGSGLYQEKGKPIEYIKKGEVMKCSPDIAHWHGATPAESMTHIAIGTNTNTGGATWLEPVSEQEYHSGDQDLN